MRRNSMSRSVMLPEGDRMPCSVRKASSDVVITAGKKDRRMNVARLPGSGDGGSPRIGKPMKRSASEKFETFETARTASFQSGKERDVENGSGWGCLNSQMVDTR